MTKKDSSTVETYQFPTPEEFKKLVGADPTEVLEEIMRMMVKAKKRSKGLGHIVRCPPRLCGKKRIVDADSPLFEEVVKQLMTKGWLMKPCNQGGDAPPQFLKIWPEQSPEPFDDMSVW